MFYSALLALPAAGEMPRPGTRPSSQDCPTGRRSRPMSVGAPSFDKMPLRRADGSRLRYDLAAKEPFGRQSPALLPPFLRYDGGLAQEDSRSAKSVSQAPAPDCFATIAEWPRASQTGLTP